jgi:hypothetical protein
MSDERGADPDARVSIDRLRRSLELHSPVAPAPESDPTSILTAVRQARAQSLLYQRSSDSVGDFRSPFADAAASAADSLLGESAALSVDGDHQRPMHQQRVDEDLAPLRAQRINQREEEDSTAPLTGFQVDCADAILFVHQALMLTGDKTVSASNMSDVYLVIAEVVNQLQRKLRTTRDPLIIKREVQEAKIGVFDSWMQSAFARSRCFCLFFG